MKDNLAVDQAVAMPGITLNTNVVPTVFADGAILLDLRTKFFYRVNQTGWAVIQLIEDDAAAPESIVERCREWGIGTPEPEEILAFLRQLEDFELLDRSETIGNVPEVETPARWVTPSIEKQSEPLHRLVTSAFDPSIPLAE